MNPGLFINLALARALFFTHVPLVVDQAPLWLDNQRAIRAMIDQSEPDDVATNSAGRAEMRFTA